MNPVHCADKFMLPMQHELVRGSKAQFAVAVSACEDTRHQNGRSDRLKPGHRTGSAGCFPFFRCGFNAVAQNETRRGVSTSAGLTGLRFSSNGLILGMGRWWMAKVTR